MKPMIEVLFFDGCPNQEPTLELAREVVRELGIEAEIREVRVRDSDEAQRLRFLGSPSVRVDGVDIDPQAPSVTKFSFCCRMYGESGVPSRELLVAALNEGAR
ncbi:MAG: hypothetical protein ABFS46_11075 [Myxococcota bacterium]